MAQDPRALLQKVRTYASDRQPQQATLTDGPFRQIKHLQAPAEALASSVDEQRSMRTQQISTHKPQTHFECRSKVLNSYAVPPNAPPNILDFCTLICPFNSTGKEAGQAFERAAQIQIKNLNEPDDAANTLTEAFKSYRKSDPEDAARVLQQAISHYTSKGNFRRAATHQQNLAEVYEVEIGDQKRAVEAYETAAGWFESDNAEA